MSEKKRKEREKERRDQYKQVQVHVKKDDGRLQAYGWSLPARVAPATAAAKDAPRQSQVPVPVPVYCRPLLEQANGMKVGRVRASSRMDCSVLVRKVRCVCLYIETCVASC